MASFFPRFRGADHARLRRMVAGSFTPKRVEQLRPRIENIVSELLDEVEEAGPGVDLFEAYALPLPSIVIGEILGIASSEHRSFHRMCAGVVDFSLPPEEAFKNFMRLNDYVGDLVAQNHKNPTDGLIGALVEQRHGEVGDEEIVGMVSALVVAGHETSASTIALSALALAAARAARHPARRRPLHGQCRGGTAPLYERLGRLSPDVDRGRHHR